MVEAIASGQTKTSGIGDSRYQEFVFLCLFVCLFVCMLVCLNMYLFVCVLLVCFFLSVSLLVSFFVSLFFDYLCSEKCQHVCEDFEICHRIICFATPDLQNHMNRRGTNTGKS